MRRLRLRAAFYRGGTSKAIMLNAADLPVRRELRDRIFLHVMGSPDVYRRQLDGMGGGLSSLSKVVIVEPSVRDDADVDYTFVQIAVDEAVADYGQMCGNMSSAVGPFALEEGIVTAADDTAVVRVHNTNTGRLFHSAFAVREGRPVEEGDFRIPGVGRPGAKVKLEFLNPGGAATGKLLPTGNALDDLEVEGVGTFKASMVDSSNPVVFLRAADIGIGGHEHPAELDEDTELLERMDRIRRAAAVAMGMADTARNVLLSNPKIAVVAPSAEFVALGGRRFGPEDHHFGVRLISMGNFHRAITLTGAMCAAVAARIPGTLVNKLATDKVGVLIGNPSGVLPVQADTASGLNGIEVKSVSVFRTQRRIMEGFVHYPQSLGF